MNTESTYEHELLGNAAYAVKVMSETVRELHSPENAWKILRRAAKLLREESVRLEREHQKLSRFDTISFLGNCPRKSRN